MRSNVLVVLRLTAGLGGLAGGCGPGTASLDAAAPDVLAPAPDAPVLPGAITFRVLSFVGTGADGPPIRGAEVLVDHPDGTRVQATTDAEGRAEVAGIMDQPVHLTFWAPGHMTVSIADVDRASLESWRVDGDVLETLRPLAAGFPTVTGRARGMRDEGHALMISALHAWQLHTAIGPDYATRALPGHSLVLVAAEIIPEPFGSGRLPQIVQWAYAEGGPPAEGASLDVDFAAGALAPLSFSGSYAVPEALRGLSGVDAWVEVDGARVGRLTELVETEGLSTFSGEYVEVATDEQAEILTTFLRWDAATGRYSAASAEGYPSAGSWTRVLPRVPVVLSPGGDRAPLGGSVEIDLGDPSLVLVASVSGEDQTGRWLAYSAQRGATAFTMPTLPPGALAQLGPPAERLSLQVYLCESELPERGRLCRRAAGAAPIPIAR